MSSPVTSKLFANSLRVSYFHYSFGSLDDIEMFKNAGERILELWMSREEPQLNLLQSQMLVKEKSMLH